jgi:AcrR family transcriptional regulator
VGRPTVEELERRKARVLEVATRLFVHDGYMATSLVDIAKEAGVATRTIYQHFGDKNAVFREVIYARDIATEVLPPEVKPNDSLHDALVSAGRYLCELTYRKHSVDLMRLMISERNRFAQLTKKVANGTSNRLHGNVERVFDEVAKRGAIPRGDHMITARYFVDFILGGSAINLYAEWDSEIPDEQEIDSKVSIFILGRFGPEVAAKAKVRLRSDSPRKGRKLIAAKRAGSRSTITRRARAL